MKAENRITNQNSITNLNFTQYSIIATIKLKFDELSISQAQSSICGFLI